MKFLSDLTARELSQKRSLMKCDLNVSTQGGGMPDMGGMGF